MIVFLFQCCRKAQCRTVLVIDDVFPFESIPQTISYWGLSSFPDCSASSSSSISLMSGLILPGVVFRSCQVFAFLYPSLGSPVLWHSRAWCPGFPHLKDNFSLIRRWNSLLERLRFGCLLVASRSIGSPLCSMVLNVPSEFLRDSEVFIVAGSLHASVAIKFFSFSFLMAHCARPSISSISSSWCSQACRRSLFQLLINIRCREWSSQFASLARNRNLL